MANITLSLYGKDLDMGFDCSGALKCKWCMGMIMPPPDDDSCGFQKHGACTSPAAQAEVLERLKRRLTKEIKERDNPEDER